MKSNIQELRQFIRKMLLENIDTVPNVSTNNRRGNLKRYIIDNLDFTGYPAPYNNLPESQYIEGLINLFKEEKGWDVERKGLKNAFIDYIRGMPSCLDIATYYNEVQNLLYAIGYDEIEDMDDGDIDKLYYNEIFAVVFNK